MEVFCYILFYLKDKIVKNEKKCIWNVEFDITAAERLLLCYFKYENQKTVILHYFSIDRIDTFKFWSADTIRLS